MVEDELVAAVEDLRSCDEEPCRLGTTDLATFTSTLYFHQALPPNANYISLLIFPSLLFISFRLPSFVLYIYTSHQNGGPQSAADRCHSAAYRSRSRQARTHS